MKTKNILVLEPLGTFGHGAARAYVRQKGIDAVFTFCRTNLQICQMLAGGHGDLAVVPLENNIAGLVPDWLTWCMSEMRLGTSRLKIIAEIVIPITQQLMSLPRTKFSDIKAVLSHERAVRQCSNLLSSMSVRIIETASTAEAAETVSKSDPSDGLAAIAADAAAEEYGLKVLNSAAENNPGNITRFAILQRRESAEVTETTDTKHRVVVVFDVPHEAGALHRITGELLRCGANMTSLRDLPQGLAGRYSYSFYLEYDIPAEKSEESLRALSQATAKLVRFGNFPLTL